MDIGSITLAIAITGAVTGILGLVFNFLNTWRIFDRDRVKLKVIPKFGMWVHPTLGSEQMLCVEVINTGFIPVTLDRVVFPMDGMDQELFFMPNPLRQVKLPARLEPRESITIYAPSDLHHSKEFYFVSRVRAYTACGRKFHGTSPALKSAVKKLRDESCGS